MMMLFVTADFFDFGELPAKNTGLWHIFMARKTLQLILKLLR